MGRASQWAAKAFKARAHLFQNEFSEAKPLLDDIINNGPFQLESTFYNNFDEEHQNNGESIFEIQYSVNDGAGVANSGIDHQTLYPRGTDVGLCCAYSAPSFDLFNAFKVDANGLPMLDTYQDNLLTEDYGKLDTDPFTPTDQLLDPRVDWTLGRRGIPFLDWGPMSGSDWMLDQLNMGPFLNKKLMWYQRNKGEISTQSSYWAAGVNGNNFRVLRLGHVLLWRAEVAVEENDLATALALVNRIRERAADDILMGKVLNQTFGADDPIEIDETQPAANYKLGLYTAFPDQEYARKAVRHEMRLEFALEGMRFYDLVRWGIDAETLNTYLGSELAGGRLPWLQGATYTAGQDDHWPQPMWAGIMVFTVTWPDGKKTIIDNPAINGITKVDYSSAELADYIESKKPTPLFSDITQAANLHHRQDEIPYNDFGKELLLPHKLSENGSFVSVVPQAGKLPCICKIRQGSSPVIPFKPG